MMMSDSGFTILRFNVLPFMSAILTSSLGFPLATHGAVAMARLVS